MSHGRPINPGTTIVRHSGEVLHRELEVDLCVIGAGISGATTALEAARLGRRVAIVDGLPALGGQAVNSIIGTFCGLYRNGTHGHRFTFGIVDDMLDWLQSARRLLLSPRPDDDGRALQRDRAERAGSRRRSTRPA